MVAMPEGGMKESGEIVSRASFTRVPLSPTQSLPLEGKVASEASRIGY